MRNLAADCLDRLEEIIENGITVPITGKKIINRIEALELIDQLRISFQEELKQAAQGKDRTLGVGKVAPQVPLTESRELPKNLSSHELVVAAQIEADRIVEQAKREAKEIKAGAEDYAENTLVSLEDTLNRTARIVRKGVDELSKRKGGHIVSSVGSNTTTSGIAVSNWNQTGTFPKVK